MSRGMANLKDLSFYILQIYRTYYIPPCHMPIKRAIILIDILDFTVFYIPSFMNCDKIVTFTHFWRIWFMVSEFV